MISTKNFLILIALVSFKPAFSENTSHTKANAENDRQLEQLLDKHEAFPSEVNLFPDATSYKKLEQIRLGHDTKRADLAGKIKSIKPKSISDVNDLIGRSPIERHDAQPPWPSSQFAPPFIESEISRRERELVQAYRNDHPLPDGFDRLPKQTRLQMEKDEKSAAMKSAKTSFPEKFNQLQSLIEINLKFLNSPDGTWPEITEEDWEKLREFSSK